MILKIGELMINTLHYKKKLMVSNIRKVQLI